MLHVQYAAESMRGMGGDAEQQQQQQQAEARGGWLQRPSEEPGSPFCAAFTSCPTSGSLAAVVPWRGRIRRSIRRSHTTMLRSRCCSIAAEPFVSSSLRGLLRAQQGRCPSRKRRTSAAR